jgi:hypothetical protein
MIVGVWSLSSDNSATDIPCHFAQQMVIDIIHNHQTTASTSGKASLPLWCYLTVSKHRISQCIDVC